MMSTQPMLDEREWSLVLELLQNERQELPVELHHTDTREYADQLEERKSVVDGLISRLQAQGITS